MENHNKLYFDNNDKVPNYLKVLKNKLKDLRENNEKAKIKDEKKKDDRQMTQEELAQAFVKKGYLKTCHKNTIHNAENDASTVKPSLPLLMAYCEFFDADIDALLGKLQDYKKHGEKYICAYTGLSEAAVRKLHNSAYSAIPLPFKQLLSAIICEDNILSLLDQFMRTDDIALERHWFRLSPKGDFVPEQEILPVDFSDLSINGMPVDIEMYRQSILNLLRDALIKLQVPGYLPPEWRLNDDDASQVPFE